MLHSSRTVLCLIFSTLLLIGVIFQIGVQPVYAHFNTLAPDTDVQLQWPLNGSYSMSVDLKVTNAPQSNASIFWGLQFSFMNGERGFIALGIGGQPKVATVGVFDAANATTNNPTGGCEQGISFLKAGNGYQCFILFSWNLGSDYQLQFSQLSNSEGYEEWQGSIQDHSTNSSTLIGNILVPSTFNQLGTNSSTWDEYSTAGSCDTTPTSVVFFNPYALSNAGNHAPGTAQVTYGNNACQDSNVQYLGGGAYKADAGRNVTRTTPPETWLWTQEPILVSQNSASTTTASTGTSTSEQTTSSTANTYSSTSSSTTTTPLQQAPTSTSSNMTPLSAPAMPGFPWESILAGIVIGLAALGIMRRRRK